LSFHCEKHNNKAMYGCEYCYAEEQKAKAEDVIKQKREERRAQFMAAAITGLLANPNLKRMIFGEIADCARSIADHSLKALEPEQP
jgi:hypothetical protein